MHIEWKQYVNIPHLKWKARLPRTHLLNESVFFISWSWLWLCIYCSANLNMPNVPYTALKADIGFICKFNFRNRLNFWIQNRMSSVHSLALSNRYLTKFKNVAEREIGVYLNWSMQLSILIVDVSDKEDSHNGIYNFHCVHQTHYISANWIHIFATIFWLYISLCIINSNECIKILWIRSTEEEEKKNRREKSEMQWPQTGLIDSMMS